MPEIYTAVQLSPLRKVIAARMTEAKQTIPHYRLGVDIRMDALMAAREALRAGRPGAAISLNDLLIKACASALMEMPAVNIQWVGGVIHRYPSADISVVMAIDGGLSTPIIRAAETKSEWAIAREVRELSARAAANTLKMQEVFGGTFTISNLGMYGVDEFDAIINAPQCAILALGRAAPRVVADNGGMAIATMLRATLSVDHRAIDGAVGAQFLSTLRQYVEQPDTFLVGAAGGAD